MSETSGPHHFLSLYGAGGAALAAMLNEAAARKAARAGRPRGAPDEDAPLAGHVLATIFEKPSTRTRVSFHMAMRQLGGQTLLLDAGHMQLGRGESIADTARVLGRYVDALMLRTDDPAKLDALARHAGVPVVNGLTDAAHPCQIMADLLTLIENGKRLPGLKVAWLGDGNNVLASWIEAAAIFRMELRIACPPGHGPAPKQVEEGRGAGAQILLCGSAAAGAEGADVVVTDCWISMGQADGGAKQDAMRPYQVNEAVMARAAADALFLHCLPAHIGEEVTEAVFEGPQSRVFDEAENRLHAQKAILLWCLGKL